MALTQSQEGILEQIIEAYQNGKRLSDLPDVSGTNPFELYCEVLDTDGESKKATLASLLPYIEEDCSYGIEFDTAVSSPTCTRIGNLALHRSLPVQSRMKGCLLDDDGHIVEYLDPQDWTGQVRDGSRGQVMVEVPMHYRKFETLGTKRRVRLSDFPLPGYHQVRLKYHSAYDASLQRSTQKLASVANSTPDYRGGTNTNWDGTYRSLLGRPVTGISRTQFRNYARNRKSGSTKWNCQTYDAYKDIFWLFTVEYATLNSQAAFNAQLTTEGYHQGGLGAGVTDWNGTAWNSFNSYNPFVPCGHTDTLGNGTGTVQYDIKDGSDVTLFTTYANRYRGLENPFGHIWKWTDGINVRISPNVEAGGDGLSKVFTCGDPSKFKDNGYDGYSHVGNEARTMSYVKKIIFGEYGEIMPSEVGGGSTTYHCDYHYTDIPASAEALRGVLFGGNALSGAAAGFAFADSNNAPSNAHADVGSRLCFLP